MSLATRYTPKEEFANVATHGVGVAITLLGSIYLLSLCQNTTEIIACLAFCLSLIVLLTASTTYHFVKNPEQKSFWRTMDHIAIFGLIAGTYTPYTLLVLKGALAWKLFAVIWGIAILGAIVELSPLKRHRWALVTLYLAMGWMGVLVIGPLKDNLSQFSFFWLVAGGLFYTIGVIFYVGKRIPFNHAVWHLFVLAGALSHYWSIVGILKPIVL